MIQNKRGITELVFYSLAIVFVILGVVLIWVGILPLIQSGILLSSQCTTVDVSINRYSGYTCFDPNSFTSVQVRSGTENSSLASLKFYLSSEGDSYYYQKDFVMQANAEKTFYLNSSNLRTIDSIKLVPVVKRGKTEKDCTGDVVQSVQPCISASLEGKEILQQGVKTP